jgi:hypothetical protein
LEQSSTILAWVLVAMYALTLLAGPKLLCAKADGVATVELAFSKCCVTETPALPAPADTGSCASCTDTLLPSDQSIRASISSDVELGGLLQSVVLVPICVILPSLPVCSPPWPDAGRHGAVASAQVLDVLSSIVIRC